jgi:hypothetical protein
MPVSPARADGPRRAAGIDRQGGSVGWALAGLSALGASLFLWVRPTNFRGYDEWLIFSLLSRGIVGFPYANRPLNLLWALPAWALAPDRLWGFLLVHAVWLTLGGLLVCLLLRRMLPGAPVLAFLAGAFTVAWAPSDLTRLASVQMIVYSGCTFGTLLSAWLLVEAWWRHRPALVLLAALAGAAAVLSMEAALPLVALAPLLLLPGGGWRERARWGRWALGWLVLVTAAGWRIVGAFRSGGDELAYQTEMLLADPSPLHVLRRALGQLRQHLLPLVDSPAQALAVPAVPIAVAVFVAGFVLATRPRAQTEGGASPGSAALVLTGLAGLLLAIVAYLPFVLNLKTRGPVRTQFLSAPGTGVLLAAGVVLFARLLPTRARLAGACLLGAWVVATGASRIVALQETWNTRTAYPAQRRALLELTALAPDLEPHTLVVVLKEEGVWPLDLSFRHAVEYLYEGRARGLAAGAEAFLYETRFEPAGVVSEPLPVLRGPWREGLTRYRYDELVVFRRDPGGGLSLLDAWPTELPPLAAGVAYAPRSRIRTGAPPPRRLSILASGGR